MTSECRPPDGTPDGTVCWLVMPEHGGAPAHYAPAMWRSFMRQYDKRRRRAEWWEFIGSTAQWFPGQAALHGWRYVALATPPQETTDARALPVAGEGDAACLPQTEQKVMRRALKRASTIIGGDTP